MKCPICGKENTLYIAELTQNCRDYRIKKNGEKCKTPTNIQKDLYLDEGWILCCDNNCNVNEIIWEFVDGKLTFYGNEKYPHLRKFKEENDVKNS